MKSQTRLILFGMLFVGVVTLLAWGLAYLVPLPARLSLDPSTAVYYKDGQLAHAFVTEDGMWRMPVELKHIDAKYLDAVVRFEDKRFEHHSGVDPLAVVRAVYLNLLQHRRVSGGSTLTMQLVRMLEPRPRTLRSKVIEALRAMQLEVRLTKKEILRQYLQFLPFGGNYEGIETASWSVLGHSPEIMSLDEISTLLAIPQNPGKRTPSVDHALALRNARRHIAQVLLQTGAYQDSRVTSGTLLNSVEAAQVPEKLTPLPREAVHVASMLKANFPKEFRFETTLERGLQRNLEDLFHRSKTEYENLGIYNGSAVLADHQLSEIRAAVGNFDFFDARHAGEMIGFQTHRSTGSTLKPFLYARAIEQGIAGPDQLIPDVPVSYGSYVPRNFDDTFHGLVTLEKSLSQSLNIPFISLLQQIGLPRLMADLRSAQVKAADDDISDYGLSAAVGGLEVSPEELAGLYAVLARGGEYQRLRWLKREVPSEVHRIFPPGAVWLTRRALTLRDRPDFPGRWNQQETPNNIFWKTGTSFGHRDAWAAGANLAYTAVVWLGNFDRTPSNSLVGAPAAGPLLFDILESVQDRAKVEAVSVAPRDLIPVQVCEYSGFIATPACPHEKTTLALRSAVPTQKCPFHTKLEVDAKSGLRLNATCRPSGKSEVRSYLKYPLSYVRWANSVHLNVSPLPSWAPGCQKEDGVDRSLEIVSPVRGQTLFMLPGLSASQQEVALEADGAVNGVRVSWFVDAEFQGSTNSSEAVYWTPNIGKHRIVAQTDSGEKTSVELEVRLKPQ